MKKMWLVIVGCLVIFTVTACKTVRAEEQVSLAQDDLFLAISFKNQNPNLRKFKFKEGIALLDIESLYRDLEKIEGINQVSLYKDGISVARKEGSPWDEIQKKVMYTLKEQLGYTGYVLLDGNNLTPAQIEGYLSKF